MSLLQNSQLDKKSMIINWLEGMDIKNYIINPDMTIDVDGSVFIQNKNIGNFPPYINFRKVCGTFNCQDNNLTSLRGCPCTTGTFNCSNNKLKTLKGCPHNIYGSLFCSYNHLETLEGCPTWISGTFDCSDNNLSTLKGCPEKVYGGFYCGNNNKKFKFFDAWKICDFKGIFRG